MIESEAVCVFDVTLSLASLDQVSFSPVWATTSTSPEPLVPILSPFYSPSFFINVTSLVFLFHYNVIHFIVASPPVEAVTAGGVSEGRGLGRVLCCGGGAGGPCAWSRPQPRGRWALRGGDRLPWAPAPTPWGAGRRSHPAGKQSVWTETAWRVARAGHGLVQVDVPPVTVTEVASALTEKNSGPSPSQVRRGASQHGKGDTRVSPLLFLKSPGFVSVDTTGTCP